MTNKRRMSRASKPANILTEDQTMDLLEGWSLSSKQGSFKSEEHRRELWEQNRENLLNKKAVGFGESVIEREPFTRPAAWWDYEAPEPRRVIKNSEYWRHIEGYHFGKMRLIELEKPFEQMYFSYSEAPELEYESEKDYLTRLNLLNPKEKELLE